MVREFRETRAKKLFFWLAKISLLKPKAKFSRATFFRTTDHNLLAPQIKLSEPSVFLSPQGW
ncbi:hypothetical protein HMPREF1990_01454 [Porphyromonas gingivalis W4087]|nr:hypothetical protein HMPREF1989_00914 [Porphyromonas gingivalis F0566]ERJ88206.1 hypothetical protein HMPREF1990_01454 [Porphyromonas gingivalis W4087]